MGKLLIFNLIATSLIAEETLQQTIQAKRIEQAAENVDKIEDSKEREAWKAKLKDMESDIRKQAPKITGYEKHSMEHNLMHAVFAVPLRKGFEQSIAKEIKRRPEEFKEAVEKMLAKEELVIEEMTNLPHWAKFISDEYQMEIASRVISMPIC